jgi:hypothetical protein
MNADGGFCFGKIKAEARVNTLDGEDGAFILTERKTCMGPPYTINRIESHRRDTLLLKSKINLDKDVIERNNILDELTDDEMFVLIMGGTVERKNLKNPTLLALIEYGGGRIVEGVGELAKDVLNKRLQQAEQTVCIKSE